MECDNPISIKLDPPRIGENNQWIYNFPAGCGKCLPCLIKRKSQWSLRMVEEMRNAFSAYFVTLTYDADSIPIADDRFCGNKNDHTHFIKWLKYYELPKNLNKRDEISTQELERKRYKTVVYVDGVRKKFKYYGVIEYGSRYSRPHLHYILFNVVDIANIHHAWSKQVRIAKGLYKPGKSFGRIQIDECNVNTIDYVLKYMVKPQNDMGDIQKEVSFMSKGMGLSLVDSDILNHIKREDGNALLNIRGSKVGLPRYYQKKFLSDEERNSKIKYISARKKEDDKIKEFKYGSNLGKVEANGKEARYNNLKNIKKRNLE